MEELRTFDHNLYRGKAGIYRFYNKKNGKSYVGQSTNLGVRLSAHKTYIKRGTSTQVIYKAFRKYGIENFYVEILTVLPIDENIKKNLDTCEKIYIDFYNSYKNGYNSTIGGDGGILGYQMSDEERKRRSLSQRNVRKDPLLINVRAKKVYMYNIKTGKFFVASSTMDAENLASAYGYALSCGNIQDCACGRHKTTGGFVCSYDLEELKQKLSIL